MVRRKYFGIVFSLVTFFFICFSVFPNDIEALEKVKLYLFYSDSCPHCAAEKEYLSTLQKKHSNLEIELLEVTKKIENSDLLDKVKQTLGTENNYVPYTVIGKIGLTGYNDNVARQIEHFIEKYSYEKSIDIVEAVKNGELVSNEENMETELEKEIEEEKIPIVVPILGEINPKQVSLPLLAIIIGFIDGFNPCAMWVLLFLIGVLVGMKDRKRMWVLGFTFLITSALIYLLFMVSWLKIAVSISSVLWIQKVIALIAFLAGIWNLYSFMKTKEVGCLIVKEAKRKKTLSQIRKITTEQKFVFAFLGVIVLAISVNFVELACSAGFPLIFTQILALNNLTNIEYIFYIIFYIFFFLIDDLFVFFIAMFTMKITSVSNKYARYSHLVGGAIMILIGLLLFFKPEWLMLEFL
ncbi:MAG: hypothetical protein HFH08_05065 [Bacilli bacterium]|nr:hypothetical protein [Bacilli bacterium]